MAITASNNLRKGSKGDDVKALQTALNNYGYGLDVDGSFGSKTQAAVRDYQSRNGLTVDGVVGTNTWGKLSGGSQAASDASSAAAGASSGSSSQSSSTATLTALQQAQANKPTFNYDKQAPTYTPGQPAPTYTPTYQEQIAALTDKVMNRGPFQYDLNGDMLYNQYKDQYMRLGRRASEDAQAQAAALSGGYGNSYGATAGNQAYQNYLNALNDRIPELEQRAFERWQAQGQENQNMLQLYRDMENQDYNRYRDQYGDWNDERNFGYNQYLDALSQYNQDRNFAYNQYADALSQYNADRAFEYQAEQDAYDRALQEAALAAKASGGSSSGGGGGRGRSGSSKSSSSGTTVSGTSQANAALNDLGNEFQSFASANDPKGMQTYLQKLVKAGYLTSQNATMIYNRYFPTTTSKAQAGIKSAKETLRVSKVR